MTYSHDEKRLKMDQVFLFSTRPVMHDVQNDLVISQWKQNHSDLVTMICYALFYTPLYLMYLKQFSSSEICFGIKSLCLITPFVQIDVLFSTKHRHVEVKC